MYLKDLRDALRRVPFKPFRLFISDGGTYDVHHPELVVPGEDSVFIGLRETEPFEPIYERFAIVDLDHVTRLEPIAVPVKGNGSAS